MVRLRLGAKDVRKLVSGHHRLIDWGLSGNYMCLGGHFSESSLLALIGGSCGVLWLYFSGISQEN